MTRLNLSSSPDADDGADVEGPPDIRFRGPPPTERRPEEEDGRWIGTGRLPTLPPRALVPPPRPSFAEGPYIVGAESTSYRVGFMGLLCPVGDGVERGRKVCERGEGNRI